MQRTGGQTCRRPRTPTRSTLYAALPELQATKRGDQATIDAHLAQLLPDSRPGPPTLEKYDALLTRTGR